MNLELFNSLPDRLNESANIDEGFFDWSEVEQKFGLNSDPEKRMIVLGCVMEAMEPNFDTLDIKKLQVENGFIIIRYLDKNGETKEKYFDIFSEELAGSTLDEALTFREEDESHKNVKGFIDCVNAMESIFQNNEREIFDFLDDKDVLGEEIGEDLQGKSIKEIQLIARDYLESILKLGGKHLNPERKSEWEEISQKYTEMVMGVGDIYEGGAKLFHKTQGEVVLLTHKVVNSKPTIADAIDYYSNTRNTILGNKRTSKTNKRAVEMYLDLLGKSLFERMQTEDRENTDDILIGQFLQLAKMVRGKTETFKYKHRDPRFATEILMYVMERRGGLLDKIDKSKKYNIQIDDPEVGDTSPSSIVGSLRSRLSELGIEDTDQFLINGLGISKVTLVNPGDSYDALNISKKQEVSILARLLKKLHSNEINQNSLSDSGLQKILSEIYTDAMNAVKKGLKNNFSATMTDWNGMDSGNLRRLDDVEFSDNELEVLDLFRDISGSGIFDWSDGFENGLKTVGITALKIVAVMAVVIAVTVVTGGTALPVIGGLGLNALVAVGAGAAAGTAASLAFIDPRGHDSAEEMAWDVGTDFALNTVHAVAAEKIILKSWGAASGLGKTGLISGDIISGMGLEVLRDVQIEKAFHGEPLFQDQEQTRANSSDDSGYKFPELMTL